MLERTSATGQSTTRNSCYSYLVIRQWRFNLLRMTPRYKEQHGSYEAFDYGTPLAYEIDHFRRGLTTKIKRLDGIREQLDLYDEPSDAPQRTSGSEDCVASYDITRT